MSDVMPINEGSFGGVPSEWEAWLQRCALGVIHREQSGDPRHGGVT
ncbi:UNVERIFIED_ORG: hypothetical protein GGE64_005072 [Rhizobium etli]